MGKSIAIQDLKKLLDNSNKIVIAGHVNPDGDATSSSFALGLALKKIGKEVIILLGDYAQRYNILKGSELIFKGDYKDISADMFIAVDTGTKERLGIAEEVLDRTPVTINLDHHISNNGYAMYNYIDHNASSTAEIMFDVISSFTDVDEEIGSAIYTGILSDTGGLRHESTTTKTHKIVSELISKNVPFSYIHRETMEIHTLSEAKIFAIALEHMKLVEGYPIAFSYISQEDLKRANAVYSDLDGVVEYLLNTKDIEVSLLVVERGDKVCKGSLRTTTKNVNEIAGLFGGGGHKKAAGCTVNDNIENTIEKILTVIKKEFN